MRSTSPRRSQTRQSPTDLRAAYVSLAGPRIDHLNPTPPKPLHIPRRHRHPRHQPLPTLPPRPLTAPNRALRPALASGRGRQWLPRFGRAIVAALATIKVGLIVEFNRAFAFARRAVPDRSMRPGQPYPFGRPLAARNGRRRRFADPDDRGRLRTGRVPALEPRRRLADQRQSRTETELLLQRPAKIRLSQRTRTRPSGDVASMPLSSSVGANSYVRRPSTPPYRGARQRPAPIEPGDVLCPIPDGLTRV